MSTIISLLLFTLAVAESMTTVSSWVAPWDWEETPLISIQSPVNGTHVNSVLLNFTIEKPTGWFNNQSQQWGIFASDNFAIEQMLTSVVYEIDGNSTTINAESNLFSSFNYSMNLANIEEGDHSLRIYATATGVYRNSHGIWQPFPINSSYEKAFFTVDSKPPKISDLYWSADGKSDTSIIVTFKINEPTSLISYCIDNQANITITGNTTISNLSKGAHELRVYAADYAGNIGSSETIYFNTEPFPVLL